MLMSGVVQDCGPTHPFYLPNYVAFYFAIKQAYPNMTLIANCQLGEVSLPSRQRYTRSPGSIPASAGRTLCCRCVWLGLATDGLYRESTQCMPHCTMRRCTQIIASRGRWLCPACITETLLGQSAYLACICELRAFTLSSLLAPAPGQGSKACTKHADGADSSGSCQGAPVELWDWHLYTNSWDMYKHRGDFDSQRPGRDPAIFASEYAVVDDSGFGNLKVCHPRCQRTAGGCCAVSLHCLFWQFGCGVQIHTSQSFNVTWNTTDAWKTLSSP